VLVESVSKRRGSELAGRTANNRIVNFPGSPALIDSLADVRITSVVSHSLRGELANGE
jgi:tRNA-2-methylthio-N6-dimethylallyladenosine synthase